LKKASRVAGLIGTPFFLEQATGEGQCFVGCIARNQQTDPMAVSEVLQFTIAAHLAEWAEMISFGKVQAV